MIPIDHPLVTVLTPVYNGEDYLEECIESVLKQTYQNFEYIVLNNCSTDRSLEIAQNYAKRDSRIRVHNNEKFVGVIENHNLAFGLMSLKAKYCKVVSADDFLFPECILQMVEFAETNPSIGFVGAYQLCGSYVKWQGFKYPSQVFDGVELCRKTFFQRQIFVDGNPILGFGSPTSLLYRSDLVRESDHFYPNLSPHADTSACFRYLNRCNFGFLYQILSFERLHEKTQTSKSIEMNRNASAGLSDLINYGPYYLSNKELKECIDGQLRAYHRYLASNIGVFRGKSFWDYHKGRLNELGYPLTRGALLRAAFAASMRQILNPEQAARKVGDRFGPKSKVRQSPGTAGEVTRSVSGRNHSGTKT